MGRPRTTWPAVLCPRLTIGDVLRATGQEDPFPRLIRARTDSDNLVPMAIMPTVGNGRLNAVVVSFRTMEYPYRVCSQVVSIETTTDNRDRQRPRFACPDCQDAADSLCLVPGATELVCRRCARVSYHWSPAPPPRRRRPAWTGSAEEALAASAKLRQRIGVEVTMTRRARGGMTNDRGPRRVASGDPSDDLTARQWAVAQLWQWCGWSVGQLAQLFGVSSRTVKRDLRAARTAGALPRKARRSTPSLRQRVRVLLRACARIRQTVDSACEHPQPNDPGLLWAAALQARLLAEERKLLALLAALPGADRAGLADETELPEYLDPELVQAAAEPVQEG